MTLSPKRTFTIAAAVLASTAAPAAAFDPPQLWIARAATTSDRGSNPWVPLSGAHLRTGGAYRLGVTIQPSNDFLTRQYVVFEGSTSPHPGNGGGLRAPAACSEVRGAPGDIADFGVEIYGGDGTYTLKVGMTAFVQGPCPSSGATTQDTFTVDARPSVQILGAPRTNDRRRPGPFRGVSAVLAGDTTLPEYTCARNPHLRGDGSLTGSTVTHWNDATDPFTEPIAFPASGRWGCVARAEGSFNLQAFTGWSPPTYAFIPGDFTITGYDRPDETPPNVAVRLETGDAGAAGGTITLALRTCRRYTFHHLSRRGPTVRARVDRHGNATFRFRIPREPGFPMYYVARPRFSGSPSVAKSTAPAIRIDDYLDLIYGHIISVGRADRC